MLPSKRVTKGDILLLTTSRIVSNAKDSYEDYTYYIGLAEATGKGGGLKKAVLLNGDIFNDSTKTVKKMEIYPANKYEVDVRALVFSDNSIRIFKDYEEAKKQIKVKTK